MSETGDEVIIYRPRKLQREFHTTAKRWNVVICHRRFGKTIMSLAHLLKSALMGAKFKNRQYAYIAPTYKQGKLIAWEYLKRMSRKVPNCKINEVELWCQYPNGSRIRIFGADQPDSLRGVYFDGAVLDEYDQMKESVYGEIIRPALVDRSGYCVFMGTPKGKQGLWNLIEEYKDAPDWKIFIYRASETGIIEQSELDNARLNMSAAQYNQEFECSFNSGVDSKIFKRELWSWYDEPPAPEKYDWVLQSWDTAFQKSTTADYTVGLIAGVVGRRIYLLDRFKEKVSFPELKRAVQTKMEIWGATAVLIENKASGQSLVQELQMDCDIPVIPIAVTADKITRAHSASPMVEAGMIYLPRGGGWTDDFIEMLSAFPDPYTHDDDVDALTQLIAYVTRNIGPITEDDKNQEKELVPVFAGDVDDDDGDIWG